MRKIRKRILFAGCLGLNLISIVFLLGCRRSVQTGLDRVHDYAYLFDGKRVGIVTNHTAYDSKDEHIVDVFSKIERVRVTALFGPEHGIRGEETGGDGIADEVNPEQKIPIYSLYGKTQKPTEEMLKDVDILVFDIQDVGARFYTYVYTMALAMEAAAEQGIPFVVLDRPNPIGGVLVEGSILQSDFASFVGLYPVPVRHGMTVGELARMMNEEGWLVNGVRAELTVVPMKGWNRSMWYDETGLVWRKTSPNMPSLAVATVYPGMCLFEGTNVSEGRGTDAPFLQIGAPWMNSEEVLRRVRTFDLPGVRFQAVNFTPRTIEGTAPYPKYEDEECRGIRLVVKDRNAYRSFLTGVALVKSIHDMYPELFEWRSGHFNRLCGTDRIRKMIMDGAPLDSIEASWKDELSDFLAKRKTHLLYD
ncbi:MAG: DUF1343 domain-containing protein [bacterium]